MSEHALGWFWRKQYAGALTHPWGTSARLGGLCESGWHGDCPQAPLTAAAGHGQCTCLCHRSDVAPGWTQLTIGGVSHD